MKSESADSHPELVPQHIRADVATWLSAINPWSLESQSNTEVLTLQGVHFRLELLVHAYRLAEMVKASTDPWLNHIQEYAQEIHDRKERIEPWNGFHFRRSWMQVLARMHPLAAVEQSRVLVSALVGVEGSNRADASNYYKGLVPRTLTHSSFHPSSEAAINPYLSEATASAVVGLFTIGENQRAVRLFEEIFFESEIGDEVVPAYEAYIDYCERTGNKKRLHAMSTRLSELLCTTPKQAPVINTILDSIKWSSVSIDYASGAQEEAISNCLQWEDAHQTIAWLTQKLTEALEAPERLRGDLGLVHAQLRQCVVAVCCEDLEQGCSYILDIVQALSQAGNDWQQLGIDFLAIVQLPAWTSLLNESVDEIMFGEYMAEYIRLLGETGEGAHILDSLHQWTQTRDEDWCDQVSSALVWAYASQGKLERALHIINHHISDPEVKVDALINYFALGLETGQLRLHDYPRWINMIASEIDAKRATIVIDEDEEDGSYGADMQAEDVTPEEYFGLNPLEQMWALMLEFSIASSDHKQFSAIFSRLPLSTEKKIWLMHDLFVGVDDL